MTVKLVSSLCLICHKDQKGRSHVRVTVNGKENGYLVCERDAKESGYKFTSEMFRTLRGLLPCQ